MTRWDDIEILQLIDRLQEEHERPIWDGQHLLDRASEGQNVFEDDRAAFAWELMLARDAGLVYFETRPQIGGHAPPRLEDYHFLGSLKDIQLTPFGRDRARGRVVMVPSPDPDEDDGRPIAALTLEEIARSIAQRYSGNQLPTFLVESGIPTSELAADAAGSKWEYVHRTFLGLLDGGSAGRRALRQFLGAWFSDQLHTGPESQEERDRLLTDLARQGWHLLERRFVVGERLTPRRHPASPSGVPTVFGPPSQGVRPTDCFVLLPLHEPFTTIYTDLVVPAVEMLDMTCQHAGEIFGPGFIVSDIHSLIEEAKVVVAELTGRNPNVFYELGIAHALHKPVVQLTQQIEDVPFDIRHLRTVEYEWRNEWPPQELDRLRAKLSGHFRAALPAPTDI